MHDRRTLKIDICRYLLGLMVLLTAEGANAHGALELTNGLWYVDGEFRPGKWYSVEGEMRREYAGEVTETLDLEGAYVVPGFGDAHDHGLTGAEFERDNESYLRRGVFYVANPNSMLSRTREVRAEAARPETVDVRYSHGGLTCSGGHPMQIYDQFTAQSEGAKVSMDGEAYYLIDDVAALEARWPEILAAGPDFVKVMLERSEEHARRKDDPDFYGKRGLDPTLLPAVVERAHAADLRVSVHVTSRQDFLAAVEAGADELAHLPLELLQSADARLAAQQGTVVVTTTLSHRPVGDVEDVDDLHRQNLRTLREHGVRLVLGTDSQASTVDEAKNIFRLGVLTRRDLLDLLVQQTPRWIFPDRAIGRIEDGAEASFVALNGNPLEDLGALDDVRERVKQGHVLRFEEAEEKKGIGQFLAHFVMSRGADAAIAEYHRLRQEEPDDWDFSEAQLNALGYALIQHQQVESAIAIFELNTRMYPDGFNAWDSLAEACMTHGDHERAVEYYRKSLELNPGNEGARAKLKELGVEAESF